LTGEKNHGKKQEKKFGSTPTGGVGKRLSHPRSETRRGRYSLSNPTAATMRWNIEKKKTGEKIDKRLKRPKKRSGMYGTLEGADEEGARRKPRRVEGKGGG